MRVPVVLATLAVAGCAAAANPSPTVLSSGDFPKPLAALMTGARSSQWLAQGVDRWEVWVCHVPLETSVALYGDDQLRLRLSPTSLVDTLNRFVPPYFETLSHGLYRPEFVAGGEVTMSSADEPQDCLDRALEQSTTSSRGVIAIADAEHAVGEIGGFGTPGAPCSRPPCSAAVTRRAVYVGASDFGADWGERPPMDLVEHEMGHALGWPHSAYAPTAAPPYQSAIDLMSNSAAAREADPDRRDGSGTLALNRLTAGWLPDDAVVVLASAGGEVELAPSAGTTGRRVAVLAVDDTRFLTVEVIDASGLDAHLPHSGVAVHRVTFDGTLQSLEPLVGEPPYSDLLEPGDSVSADGWTITLLTRWRLRIVPA